MLEITFEKTENPRVGKFVVNKTLLSGALEISRDSDFSEIPLAVELFNYDFIEKIFITANFIAIAKDSSYEWDEIGESLKLIIEDYLIDYPDIIEKKKESKLFVFQETPNPDVVKFICSNQILNGSLEIKKNEMTSHPISKALSENFNFIEEIFVNNNQISIIKNNNTEWESKIEKINDFLINYIQEGGKLFSENKSETKEKREFSETELAIISVLDEYVKPAIEADGGMISLVEFDEETKTAKMLLQGACSGCPSSQITLKSGIQNVLNHMLPGTVDHVESIEV